MKGKRFLLVGLVSGLALGWTLGYLRVPYVENSYSFWVGFISCLTWVALVVAILVARRMRKNKTASIHNASSERDGKKSRGKLGIVWIFLLAFAVPAAVAATFMVFHQNSALSNKTTKLEKQLQAQAAVLDSIRNGNQSVFIANLLDQVAAEMRANPTGLLTDATVARIAALSFSLQPYRLVEGDSLSLRKFSPERGQLLTALSRMPLDSASFAQIREKASFAQAYLRGMDLSSIDLRTADLHGCDLRDANLKRTNLHKANLTDAIVSGANLNAANLSAAKLVRTDLTWTELKGAILEQANLDGANLTSAVATKANFHGATFQYGKLDATTLHSANLQDVNFMRTSFVKANLTGANLAEASLLLTDLTEANFTDTDLSRTALTDDTWLETLAQLRISGAEKIRARYRVMADTSGRWPGAKFCLTPVGL